MSAKVYGNIRGRTVLIRVVTLPNTEKSTIEEVKHFAEDFFGATNITIDIRKGGE